MKRERDPDTDDEDIDQLLIPDDFQIRSDLSVLLWRSLLSVCKLKPFRSSLMIMDFKDFYDTDPHWPPVPISKVLYSATSHLSITQLEENIKYVDATRPGSFVYLPNDIPRRVLIPFPYRQNLFIFISRTGLSIETIEHI